MLNRFANFFQSLRRSAPGDKTPHDVLITIHGVEVDAAIHGLRHHGREIRLTRTEWAVLARLSEKPGHIVSHAQLLKDVWGENYMAEHRLLHDTMSRLRHRFQEAGLQTSPIETIHGVGYKLA